MMVKEKKRNNTVLSKKTTKSAIIMSAVVLVGKVLGFVKQSVIAWAFGASAVTDLYFAADGFMSMLGQIQSSAISLSLITKYVQLKEKKNPDRANALACNAFAVFTVIALILVILIVLFSDKISGVLGISYTVAEKKQLGEFLIFLTPGIVCTCIIGVSQGILDGNERFIPSKLLTLFFSVSIVLSIVLFNSTLGIYSLVIGFLTGYCLHAVYVLILALKHIDYVWINPLKNRDFKKVIKGTLTLVIGNSIIDLGNLIDRIIASSGKSGSVSLLYYGQVMSNDIVNATIITTLGTILLPKITKSISRKIDNEILIQLIRKIVDSSIAIMGLVVALYLIEGIDLAKICFERGNFLPGDTNTVNLVACCYALGFPFMICREVFTKILYAYQDTITPMKNSIVGMLINLVLSFLLAKRLGIKGIALASTISVFLITLMLVKSINKYLGRKLVTKNIAFNILKVIIALIVTLSAGYVFRNYFRVENTFLKLMVTGILESLVYTLSLFLTKHSIIKYFIENISSKGEE